MILCKMFYKMQKWNWVAFTQFYDTRDCGIAAEWHMHLQRFVAYLTLAHRRTHRHVTFCRFLFAIIKTARRKRAMSDGLSEWLAWNEFDQSGNLFDAAFLLLSHCLDQHIDICDSCHAIYRRNVKNVSQSIGIPCNAAKRKKKLYFYVNASKRRIKNTLASGHTFWLYDTLGRL